MYDKTWDKLEYSYKFPILHTQEKNKKTTKRKKGQDERKKIM